MKNITIINSAVITAEGEFSFKKTTTEQVKALIKDGFSSAIGHESTSLAASKLLGVEVLCNRVQLSQNPNDLFVVFKPKNRLPEGKILTIEEIEEVGFEWFILTMK